MSLLKTPSVYLAARTSVGDDQIWDAATAALQDALTRKGWSFGVDEGGGAFYGPKIDVKIRDAIGRTWQCSTVQCDFNLPERFDLEYVSSEVNRPAPTPGKLACLTLCPHPYPQGDRQRPIMVHRAIFGSMERFFGILVENTAGDLPLWCAPVQLKLLPVTDEARSYCKVRRECCGTAFDGAVRTTPTSVPV